MNCLEVRRALGAEPHARSPELESHLAECPACARHAAELARLDAVILQALRVPVPAAGDRRPARVAPPVAVARPRRHALAAAVAATVILAGLIWSAYPREALATALVAHMRHEPQAWAKTEVPTSAATLRAALGGAATLDASAVRVTYAQSCFFRGRYVPHLVVQTDAGPMTVMVLPREHVAAQATIDEGGFRGIIVPAPHGSLAVLAPSGTDPAAIDAALLRVRAALHYSS